MGSGVAALCLVAGVVGGVALAGDDDEPAGVAEVPSGLPLVGIDLVGYTRDPSLDPDSRIGNGRGDLTYVAFTGDEPDVLGPMISASSHPGDLDPGGTPVDLDGDGAVGGVSDGWFGTYPGGANVTWSLEGEIASVNGHGVTAGEVLVYARSLNGVPFDLETMPAPEGLERREVVTFEPVPDFASRVSSYQGAGVVHVLTTDDPGYFDLTRIVSTEGTPYEEIGFESSFLGPGEAILSPDDDGPTSALVRTDAGLVIHVFGASLDAETLRAAIEQDHLVDLSAEAPTPTTTTVPVPASTTTIGTTTSIVGSTGTIPPPESTRIAGISDDGSQLTLEFDGPAPVVHDVAAGVDPVKDCADGVAMYDDLLRNEGRSPHTGGWITVRLRTTLEALIEGPVVDADGDIFVLCRNQDGLGPTILAFPFGGEPPAAMTYEQLTDPTRLVIDLPA